MTDADIERMARAACEAVGQDWDYLGGCGGQQEYFGIAKAILEAMWRPIDECPDDRVVTLCDVHGNQWTGIYPDHDEACGYSATHYAPLIPPPEKL
jgi:hypothetical protein